MIRKQPTWYMALLTVVIVGLDQLTKYLVRSNLELYEDWMPIEWLAPIVTITRIRNSGASFGMFPAGGLFFTIIGFIVVAAIVYYYHSLEGSQWWVRTALGMQLGGALGNLADRVRFGSVTDFVNFKYFPVFNVADSAIVIGVVILIIVTFMEDRREARGRAAESAPANAEGDAVGG